MYVIFERRTTRTTTPAASLTTAGRIGLNAATARLFQKNAIEFVILMWDAEQRKIGIRQITKRDSRAFRVTFGKASHGASISAQSFLDHLGVKSAKGKSFPVSWNERESLFEFSLRVEKKAKKPVQPVTAKNAKRQAGKASKRTKTGETAISPV